MLIKLIIAAILFIGGLSTFLVLNTGNVDSRNRKALLFLLLFSIIITIPALLGFLPAVLESTWWFILLQTVYLCLGTWYQYLLRKQFFGTFKNEAISNTVLLFANAGLGYIGFTLLFDYLNHSEMGHLFGMSILLFVVPYLFMLSFELMLAIPHAIHKIWYYPTNEDEPDFDNIDLNKIFFIELEFSKSPSETQPGNYKAKAPVDMLVKDWFRSFINNYNYKFEEDPIHYLNDQGEPYGWMFFTKPTLWKSKRYVDPDLSIKDNKLDEKTVIVAKRVAVEN